MESDTHLLYFTKLSGKSRDFYFLVGIHLNELPFDRMINSFSSRYLILGDFNGHSHLWGANQENERGKVEKLIDHHNLILLNDCSYSV